MAQKIKRNDMVKVIAGKDIDKRRKKFFPLTLKNHKVVVEGINMATKTYKNQSMQKSGWWYCSGRSSNRRI